MNYHSVLFEIPHSSQPFFRLFFLGLIESDETVVIELCCHGIDHIVIVIATVRSSSSVPQILPAYRQSCYTNRSNLLFFWRFGFFQRSRVRFPLCSSRSFGLVPCHQSRPYLFPAHRIIPNSSEVAARRGGTAMH